VRHRGEIRGDPGGVGRPSPAQGGGRRTDDGGSAESWVCLVGREMKEKSHLGITSYLF
jgi:hypothetical protein